MKALWVVIGALVILAVVAVSPLPIRPYLDFQVIYHADLGLLQGISIYDHAGQVNMIARLANVTPNQVFVIPFPYPPWYALSTVWLALLPIDLAARLWFGLNLIMLCVSLWLLTEGLGRLRAIILAVAALLFPPVLGSLFVGQYIFPVLLGAAMMIKAFRQSRAGLVAVAAGLLTFKPHLGGLLLSVAAVYLWQRRAEIGRRSLPLVAAMAGALFVVGFAASPAWPIDYFHSLTGFEGVSRCGQCTNLSMVLAGALGGGFKSAVLVAIVLLALAVVWLVKSWKRLADESSLLISAGILITLLVSPYLQNYDYVLLLVPMVTLASRARGIDWILLGLAYVSPFVGLGLLGPAGNDSLVLSALLSTVLLVGATLRLRDDGAPTTIGTTQDSVA